MLSPATLAMYREVCLLPTSRTDDKRAEQILTSGLQMEISLDELVDQLLNQEMARSLNAFSQLLTRSNTREEAESGCAIALMLNCP
jgi:transaldolase